MKFHSAAANGLGTGAFQKCNWGQTDPVVDRGLSCLHYHQITEFSFGYYCIVLFVIKKT